MIDSEEQRLINKALSEINLPPIKSWFINNGSDNPTGTALSYLILAKEGGKEKSSSVDAHSDTGT